MTLLPVSFEQEAFWLAYQAAPHSVESNIGMLLRVYGQAAIAVAEWRRVFEVLLARHPALRTTFAMVNGQLQQVVHGSTELAFEEVDCTGQSHERVLQTAEELIYRPYNLESGPLLRVYVLMQDGCSQFLLYCCHHSIGDGYSLALVADELWTVYAMGRGIAGESLAPMEYNHPQYVERQRALMAGKGQALSAFWKETLGGEVAPLDLPLDRPRPPRVSGRHKVIPFAIPAESRDRMRALARRCESTLYTVLMASFAVLLHRYSSQREVVVGVPTNRRRKEDLGTCNCFVSQIAVRGTFDNLPFTEVLQHFGAQLATALQNAEYPFSWVVRDVLKNRDPSRAPIFQSAVQILKVRESGPKSSRLLNGQVIEVAGYLCSLAAWWPGMNDMDLALEMTDREEGLVGYLRYNPELFLPDTVERIGTHYTQLLLALLADPRQRIDEIPLITQSERQTLLVDWNATAVPYPADARIHLLIEAQAERSPEAVAVQFQDRQLTYQELNTRANQLAHHLRSLGVGPDVVVGLYVERSLDMIIGLLGILKAGGAYLPIDPTYPQDRVAFLLQDAKPPVLLTQRRLLGRLPEGEGTILCLDEGAAWAGAPTDNPGVATTRDNLAYILFTSGSTGFPKGVCIPHRSLSNFLFAMERLLRPARADVFVATTVLSFDIAGLELWLPLMAGARVCIAPGETSRDAGALKRLLAEHPRCWYQATPATWRMLLDELGSGEIPVRALIGGEAAPADLLDRLAAGAIEVWNLYGPTETTIWSSVKRVAVGERPVSIGRPIGNTQIYILDGQLNPVPVGVAGELHIGGDGLARGYLNRPELTAQKFIRSPFVDDPAARIYKTGDSARFLPDGNIEYLGRLDQQVKLRGFRIELGEIESVLSSHPDVVASAAMVRQDTPGDSRLCAYVVLHGGRALNSQALRQHLGQRLPDYMVPSVFMQLPALPLTPSGKLDRKALPVPVGPRDGVGQGRPASPLEELLADLFASVLGLAQVGRDEDFFALGGHSLLATQVVSRIRASLQREVSLNALFSHPTVRSLAALLADDRSSAVAALPPLVPVSRTGRIPLSFAQQRLWFLDQLEPDSPLYNIPAAVELRGDLDVPALCRAFTALVSRHESLRTHFPSEGGQPYQHIGAPPEQVCTIEALPPGDEGSQSQWLQSLAAAEAVTPFRLAQGPLVRVRLLPLGPQHYGLLLTAHHTIFDGWSYGVFIHELQILYAAFSRGLPSPLPPLPIQVADIAVWERQALSDEALQPQIAYWRQQLAGLVPLELPTDRPRPPVFSYRGRTLGVTVPAALTRALKGLALEQGATLFMTLLTAWQALLARYSGQTDFAIGTPVAHRTRTETEAHIGFFVNTLVLRSPLNLSQRFSDALQQTKAACLAAHGHQDVPFERLVDELGVARDRSRTPLFQTMLILQNAPRPLLELPGVQSQWLRTENESAKFDLTLELSEIADGSLQGGLEYATDLWERATIERLWESLQVLLSAVIEQPLLPLGALPVMTQAQRRQLLVQWNDTRAEYPRDLCIHELFEAQAERSPDAVALQCGDHQLSYRELNAHANQLAHHLRALGVGPDVVVGLCLPRSLDLVVGLLGILKAGGAYLPIDPDHPRARIAYLLTDSQAPVVLTSSSLVERLPRLATQYLCLDAAQGEIGGHSRETRAASSTAENLAYVIYTSGSTGHPKGVMGTHRGMVNRFTWMWQRYPFAAGEVCPQKTTLSFVDAIWELWGPLLQGVPVVIIPPDTVRDVPKLVVALSAMRATRIVLVPSLLRAMLDLGVGLSSALPDLKYWVCSGEALPAELALRFQAELPGAVLLNLYGSSEVAADVTCYEVPAQQGEQPVPIGRPISNTQIYLLDAQLSPVPVGVAGELYVGGDALARGYLNRPELTAQKFIASPFAEDAAARLYKTGDRARYLADGNIEYLGRLDQQVKLRGFRIELGEIETVLRGHSDVAACALVLREDTAGDGRLCAYVVLQPGRSLDVQSLRQHLGERLPDYMIPAVFMPLPALPLTPSGKLDRQALPAPSLERDRTQRERPASPMEELLADLFGRVLGVARVGRDEDFFALGGHSLLATQVVARLRSSLQRELPLSALFSHPTVRSLASWLASESSSEVAALPPLVPVARQGRMPLTFTQQHFLPLDQLGTDGLGMTVTLAVELRGDLDVSALSRAFTALVERHESLRTCFPSHGGQLFQQIDPAPAQVCIVEPSPLGEGDAPSQRIGQLVSRAASAPFSPTTGPLIRVRLWVLGSQHHLLLMTLHQVLIDGWSRGVLARELQALYIAFRAGLPSPLPPLPIQVADVAAWERQVLTDEALRPQLAYWQRQLAGLVPLELPTDHPRPPVFSYRGRTISVTIPAPLTHALKQLSVESGATLFMTLLTAWQALLARYSGQSDFTIGTVVAHRTRTETESLISFLINVLVLRARPELGLSFPGLVRRVREVCLAAYANQDVPVDRMMELLGLPDDPSRYPLFQVMFVLVNTPQQALELPGIEAQLHEPEQHFAGHDLSVELFEAADGSLKGGLEYALDLWEQPTIERMWAQFLALLQRLVTEPDRPLGDLLPPAAALLSAPTAAH